MLHIAKIYIQPWYNSQVGNMHVNILKLSLHIEINEIQMNNIYCYIKIKTNLVIENLRKFKTQVTKQNQFV